MEKKNVVPVWVSVVYTILCVCAIAFEVFGISVNGHGAIGYALFAFEIIATVLAACYCFTGFQKSSAGIFKAVILSLLITTVLTLLFIVSIQQYFQFFAELIVFGCLSVFAIAKDIGEKRSFIMAFLMLAASIASAIYFLCTYGVSIYIASYVTSFLISVIVLVMFYGKYKDKAARGTK